MKLSLNNRLVLEAYKKEGLRADESRSKGFAMIAQKTHLKGLKVLVGTTLACGHVVKPGDLAFIKEEMLHTSPWATKIWECEGIEGKFILVDVTNVELIESASE